MGGLANDVIERRVEAARDLASTFEGTAGIIGAFLHGSSTRPYGDEESDVDLCIVVEADAPRLEPEEAFQRLWKNGRKVADLKFVSVTELGSPQVDIDHYRALHARVLLDREGRLAALLARVAEMPVGTTIDRMRVHYFEVTFLIGKIQSALRRGHRDAVGILKAQLISSAAKLLFLQRRVWPSPTAWLFHELELIEVPAVLLADMRCVLEAPDLKTMRSFRGRLDGHLLDHGATFVDQPLLLLDWLYESDDGKRAQLRWRSAW